jgi:MFS family permease
MKIFTFFQSQIRQVGKLNRPARLFLLALTLDGFLFTAYGLFFNFFILADGHSREFLGLINAMPSIAALILGLPMGMISDRIGRKLSMLIGFTLANFGIITMLLVHSPIVMLVMAFIWGAAAQLYVISQAPFMMKVSDDSSRDMLFSLSYGVFPLASTFGNILAGMLPGFFSRVFGLPMQSAAAYQVVLLVSVVSSFLVLVPILLIKEPHTVNHTPEIPIRHATFASIWGIIKRPLTIKLTLPNLVTGFGAAMLMPYLNIFFVERHHMGDQALGILFAASSLLIGVATFIGPRLVGNVGGKIRLIVLSQGVSLVFLVVMGFSPLAWLSVFGFLVRGTLMNMVAPLFDAFAMERTKEAEQGTINSLRVLAWSFGWAVGPYISGIVQQQYGFSPLFITTAVLYTLGIGLTWVFFGDKQGLIPQPSIAV